MQLNATGAALLGLLRTGPASGHALAQAAQDVLGDFWTVTRSQVYRELSAMTGAGYLSAAADAGPRQRRDYALTGEGRAAFAAWLHAEAGTDVVRIPLLLRLSFVDQIAPDRLPTLVAGARAEHAARLADYERLDAALADSPARDRVTLAFGLAYERAVLGWFDGPLAGLVQEAGHEQVGRPPTTTPAPSAP